VSPPERGRPAGNGTADEHQAGAHLQASAAELRIALDHARHLADGGVPLFLAEPARDPDGVWDPEGGTGRTGYVLPRGWQRTTADPAVVDRWKPGMALCAVMGHVVDGLDVDPRSGGSLAALNGTMPRSYGRQQTPSGGTHDLIAPLGLASRDGVLPGIDVKAGVAGQGHGFLFLAPTLKRSKVTGEVGAYRWTTPPDLDPLTLIGGDTSGEALAKRIRAVRERQAAPAAAPVGAQVSAEYVAAAVAGVLHDLDALVDLPEHARTDRGKGWDTAAFAAACQLVRAAHSGTGYTLDDAERDFREHAPTGGGFGTDRVDHKWNQAVRKVGAEPLAPQRSTPEDDFGPLDDEPAASGGLRERFPRLDLAALLDPDRPPREWVVSGLLSAGASVSLVAPAGSMKSLVSLALSLAVARGDSAFAGLAIQRQRRVLYVDAENTEDDLADRLRDLGVRPEDMAELVYLHLPSLPPLDSPAGGSVLLYLCQEYGLTRGDLVVLDSFQRVVDGAENDSDTYRAFYKSTAAPLKKRGFTVLRTDNTGKDTGRGARGSSSKRDDVDIELRMTRDGTALKLEPGKVRIAGIEVLQLTYLVDDDGRLTFTSAGDPWRESVDAARDALDRLGVPHDAGERPACDALKEAGGHTHARAAVRQAVRERKDRAAGFSRVRRAPTAHPSPDTAPHADGAPRRSGEASA
jgi:hypothetical protein